MSEEYQRRRSRTYYYLFSIALYFWLRKKDWWTRTEPIRTISQIHCHIKILPAKLPYLYQNLSQKAYQLYLLGFSYIKIGKVLGIDPKTAKKAVAQNKPKRR